MFKKYRIHAKRHSTTSWIALVLLVLYVSCSLYTDVIHRLSHAQELQDLHSEKNENDPCHRSIYHQENNSCEHKTHLTEVDKCSECQLSAERVKYLNTQQPTVTIVEKNSFEVIAIAFVVTDFSIYTSDRAPPVI